MELSKDEKIIILNQHIKNVASNIFNLQVSLIAEEAISNEDSTAVQNINNQIAKERLKESALLQELDALNTEG